MPTINASPTIWAGPTVENENCGRFPRPPHCVREAPPILVDISKGKGEAPSKADGYH